MTRPLETCIATAVCGLLCRDFLWKPRTGVPFPSRARGCVSPFLEPCQNECVGRDFSDIQVWGFPTRNQAVLQPETAIWVIWSVSCMGTESRAQEPRGPARLEMRPPEGFRGVLPPRLASALSPHADSLCVHKYVSTQQHLPKLRRVEKH